MSKVINQDPLLHLRPVWVVASLLAAVLTSSAAPSNGGFEAGLAGWKKLWTRDPDVGTCVVDSNLFRTGRQSARIEHRGARDWSFEPEDRLTVSPGDLFEMEAWLRVSGPGTVTLCVTTLDADGKTLSWDFGQRTGRERPDWFKLATRFLVPPGVVRIQPRLIGHGNAVVSLDDFSVTKKGNVSAARRSDLPATLSLSNALLTVTCSTADGSLSVTDRRSSHVFAQKPLVPAVLVKSAQAIGEEVKLELVHLASGLEFRAAVSIEPERSEFTVQLDGIGDLPTPLSFPAPFASAAGEYLVVPMNEGISYKVEDESIEPMRLIAYGGHGICMAFWGVTDGTRGHMGILETADDAAIRIERVENKLAIGPEWDSQKGQFGPARRLRYVFFDQGGHVAMCKRYRAFAQQRGLFKSLLEKRASNPNVDFLIGAVNVWCWDRDSLPIVQEMKALGLERILWSNRQSAEGVRAMNDLGILTSRYDIYQDLMNPENFPKLRGVHPDWTTEGWPKDIMIDADGGWTKGWEVDGKDGRRYACGVLCDQVAPAYARRRIPEELKSYPYRSRFIDTTTASPWRECYSKEHPLTRSESRQSKMELLRYVSEEAHLVTGCETGHDAAVPFVHYFEGMLSLGPYRVPDAGRDMQRIWKEVPEPVAKFQLGQRFRLPLWELVFHDCVVAQWYWGDYNNKLPALWDKRDLFNLLYGTPPMFMFNRQSWVQNRERFRQSYQTVCPTVRAVGYSEMIDHQFLTPDREVQATRFANGVTVVVNFGDRPFLFADTVVPPMSSRVTGVPGHKDRSNN